MPERLRRIVGYESRRYKLSERITERSTGERGRYAQIFEERRPLAPQGSEHGSRMLVQRLLAIELTFVEPSARAPAPHKAQGAERWRSSRRVVWTERRCANPDQFAFATQSRDGIPVVAVHPVA